MLFGATANNGIAVPHKNVHHKTGNQNIDADHGDNTVEVLEVLLNVQPLPLYWSRAYDNETLRPAAEAISTSRCPLECFYVPRSELLHLVNFLLVTVDSATRANGERRCSLGYRLYRIKRELMLTTEEKLNFEDLDTDQGAMVCSRQSSLFLICRGTNMTIEKYTLRICGVVRRFYAED